MKKILLILIVINSVLTVALSCKKAPKAQADQTVKNVPPDSRDKYIGKYKGLYSTTYSSPTGNGGTSRDTIISVRYGQTDSTIDVLGIDAYIDSSGSYYPMITFKNNNLNFYNRYGSPSTWTSVSFNGNRISDKP